MVLVVIKLLGRMVGSSGYCPLVTCLLVVVSSSESPGLRLAAESRLASMLKSLDVDAVVLARIISFSFCSFVVVDFTALWSLLMNSMFGYWTHRLTMIIRLANQLHCLAMR